jgi:type II restriction enzyme
MKKIQANKIKQKFREAKEILTMLGFPKQQQNERSALTLLSLLNLKPEDNWENAQDPLMGITPMMDFFHKYYKKQYKPNTRETVRRQTVHQFVQAALVTLNPDEPARPTNSPKAVYQIETSALKLLREYNKTTWEKYLHEYLKTVETLKKLYAKEREMQRIPLKIRDNKKIKISPGGQNALIKKIIEDFCPLFTPGGQVIYVGDTQKKFAFFDSKTIASLGVKISEHGKIPDVVIYYFQKNWLVLIEAVTSHGPVNSKRRKELKELFANSNAGLVYVTAFLDRHTLLKYINDISWETEVWIAESPTHLIHFNGERFLGPYEEI